MHQIELSQPEDLAAELDLHHSEIQNALCTDGAVLLRGTGISQAREFAQAGQTVVTEWMPYQDRASKRSSVDGPILTSTDTPASFTIPQHSESAFTNRWPAKILFCCTTPAETGGATPIADTRKILNSLDATLVAKFRSTGVMYVRNFSAGVGMDWRDVFQVQTREELEAYATDACIALEWLADDAVRTTQVRPAIITHPLTGEEIWFNHALALSQYSLDDTLREHLVRQVGAMGLPHNTYFGDGTPISRDQYEQIFQAHEKNLLRFEWIAGDLLVLDNMLSTHGRDPFGGPRVVLAGLADPLTWTDVSLSVAMPEHAPQVDERESVTNASSDRQPTSADSAVDLKRFLEWVAEQYTDTFDLEADLTQGFVDIGGDSVMAVELLDAANDEFDVDYSLDDFLDSDNVAEFFNQVFAQTS